MRAWESVIRPARTWVGLTNLRLLGLLAVLVVAFGLVEGEKLFGQAGLRSMAFQLPELGFLALAMMIPLLSGGLDLSIIATANLSALAMAGILTRFIPGTSGVSWGLVQLGALAVGVALATVVGLLNGYVVAYLRVSPILATLGTMTIVKGLAIGTTHGGVLSGFPTPVVFLGNGTVLGVPVALLAFLLVAVPLSVLLTHTPLGSTIAMMGSNEKAVAYSGIDTRRATVWIYLLSAMLASVGGLIMMARFDSANAAYGESYLLVTILAAVLGGVSPLGGFGRVSGVVLSLVILQLISTASIMLDLSQFITLSMWGGILLAVTGAGVLRDWLASRGFGRRRRTEQAPHPTVSPTGH